MYTISKEQTTILKGIAILIMIYHHFFGLYAIPNIQPEKCGAFFEFCNQYAYYGKACVSIFVMITGYGYYYAAQKEKRNVFLAGLCRFKSFYPFFVFMLISVYVLGCIFPYGERLQPTRWKDVLLNMVGLKHAIPDYWYIFIVIVSALIFYPLLLIAQRKNKFAHAFLFTFLVSVICFIQSTKNDTVLIFNHLFNIPEEIVSISHLLSFMIFFLAGWAFNYFLTNHHSSYIPLYCLFISSLVSFWVFPQFFLITLATGLCAIFITLHKSYIEKPLFILGSYSTCMWLNHRLIFGYWFSDFFYYQIPCPLSFAIIIVLSFLLSVCITTFWNRLSGNICKKITLTGKLFKQG